MRTIYFITGNKGKFSEVKEKLQLLDINLIQKDIGYPEIQTDSLEEVVRYGVKNIKERFHSPFIIEDAGLFINALKEFPGVFSKDVFYTIGCKGILKLLENAKERSAVFRSVYAYSESGEEPVLFKGESHGKIANVESGKGGFGYDPIFVPEGKTKTFAEMDIKEKNSVSHRGKALDKLIDFLQRK